MTNRREFIKNFLIVGGAAVTHRLLSGTSAAEVLAHALSSSSETDLAWAQVPEILKRIKPPVFPRRDFEITRYGAAGDGEKDCSAAFAQAIAACNKAGGGRDVVPAGRFHTASVHLKHNLSVYRRYRAPLKF